MECFSPGADEVRNGSPISLAPARFEWVVILATGLVLCFQLLVRPVLGLADNGDFQRIMNPFGIVYPAGQDPGFWKFITVHFAIDRPTSVEFPSSEMLLVWVAKLLNQTLGAKNVFDLRMLGAVHIALLLCGLWLALLAARPLSDPARGALGVTLSLVLTDIGYSAFFNSFYGEPASLLFFMILFSSAVLVCVDTRRAWWLAVMTISSVLFLTAKTQNLVSAPFLAMFVFYLAQRWSGRGFKLAATASGAVILVVALVYYAMTPRLTQVWTKHVAVFWELLGNSEDPAADLRALDLSAGLVRYAGTHPWSPHAPAPDDPSFHREFTDRLSLFQVGMFYLRRPSRLFATLDRSAERALLSRPQLGNHERHVYAQRVPNWISQSWSAVSRLRQWLAPTSLGSLVALLAGLAGVLTALFLRASRPIAVFLALMWMSAVAQFVCVAVTQGHIDTIKHMFLFRFIVDILLMVASAGSIEALVARARRGNI